MANTLKDLAAQLKLVGQDALSQALSDLKAYIDAQDAAGGSDASAAIAAVNAKLDTLIGAQAGDADTILNTFNEIKAFLADYSESDTLKSLIDAATTAAQNAATAAETAAKSYTDTKVGDEATRAQGAESALSGRITTLENIDVMTVAEAEKLFNDTFFPFIAVDLGLPSGKLWADHNIGAKKASDAGLYFSWGNVQGVAGDDAAGIAAMTESAYASTSGASLETDIPATAANDAAVANVGGNWRMPTHAEFQELHTNCDWTWKQVNGVNGYEVKSKASGNTNSIFLPAAGYINDGTLSNVGTDGNYWSSSIGVEDEGYAYYLYFNSEDVYPDHDYDRYYGCSVRPVQNAPSA